MVAYVYVMYSMGQMLQSAISESADSSQRRGLLFIHYGTVVIWSTFAVVWFGQELGMLSIYNAEMGNMLANFAAKVRMKLLGPSLLSWCHTLHALRCSLAGQGLHGLQHCLSPAQVLLLFLLVQLLKMCWQYVNS